MKKSLKIVSFLVLILASVKITAAIQGQLAVAKSASGLQYPTTTPTPVVSSTPKTVSAKEVLTQQNIDQSSSQEQEEQDTGIGITNPKIFDKRSLTIMLDQLNESLDRIQFVDKVKLAAALGLTQGSQTTDTSRAFSLTSPIIPGVTTERAQNAETGNFNVSKETTTQSEIKPAPPTLPDLLANPAYTPNYGMSSEDLLSEQIDLSYQIYNLRMLLEGPLSDRLNGSADGQSFEPRLQTILGFQVSLDPPKWAKKSAAFVEITVKPKNSNAGATTSLVSLMPQEKAYNSTALSTKSTSVGVSVPVKILTVGYSERQRAQNFFLYKDAEIITFQRMKGRKQRDEVNPTFGWEFRPVLGRPSVTPGTKQMFAVISLPQNDKYLGDSTANKFEVDIEVKTYWRKYDKNNATVDPKEIQSRTYSYSKTVIPLTKTVQTALSPRVADAEWHAVDDKNAVVLITGENFFTGTNVVLGNKTFRGAVNGLDIKSDQSMQLTTTVADLAAGEAIINGRYGPSIPLRVDTTELTNYPGVEIFSAEAPPLAGSKLSNLKVQLLAKGQKPLAFENFISNVFPDKYKPVIAVQNTIVPGSYNYQPSKCNVPVKTGTESIRTITEMDCVLIQVPIAEDVIKTDSVISFRIPFLGERWRTTYLVSPAATYQISVLAKYPDPRNADKSLTKVLVTGGFDTDEKSIWKLSLDKEYPLEGNNSSFRTVDIDSALFEKFKSVILIKGDNTPVLLSTSPKAAEPVKAEIPNDQNLTATLDSSKNLTIKGKGLAAVKDVYFENNRLDKVIDDKKGLMTVFLTRDVTAKTGSIQLMLKTDDGLIPVEVTIIPK